MGVIARIDRQTVDRTTVHRIWRAALIVVAFAIATACYFAPVLLIVIGVSLLALFCARLAYRDRGRYIPHLYARDVSVYDEPYQAFIARSLSELRRCRIAGHTLLHEASRLPEASPENSDELLLDLGVWLGWSTRLTADASGRAVYGFDTFEGLVEDWQIDDQTLLKKGTFALSDPIAQRFIRDTGVTLHDGVPDVLGRKVQYVKGSTYETLAPFLAERPSSPIRLFHMDLDTYESCLHALETCKDRFVEGSILVEMLAFFEFQSRYGLQWCYRAWGLEIGEMNVEKVISPWKRLVYYLVSIGVYCGGTTGLYAWAFFDRRFWRFWLGAPVSDIGFVLSAAGERKSVSLEITGLGMLNKPPA